MLSSMAFMVQTPMIALNYTPTKTPPGPAALATNLSRLALTAEPASNPTQTASYPGQSRTMSDNPRHIPDTASCIVRDLPTLSGIVRPLEISSH
jgi:hypothetical protein